MAPKTKEVGIRLSVKDRKVVEDAFKSVGKEGEAAFRKIIRAADGPRPSLVALNNTIKDMEAGFSRGRSAVAAFTSGAVGALVPVLSVAAAVNGAKDALAQFGEIADSSKAAGIDSELFQGIAYQAKLAGVEVGELSAALNTFNKNAGQAAEGKGRMVTQLKALNPALLENIQLATTQEERLRLAADAIDKARTASEKAALATALFGDAGVKLTSVFQGGAAAIDATLSKAKDLGLVVDRDLIARADELGDAFDTATQILDLQFKKVLLELAPLLTGTAQAVSGVVNMVRDLSAAIGDAVESSARALDPRHRTTQQLLKDVEQYRAMLKRPEKLWDADATRERLGAAEAELGRRKTRGPHDPVGGNVGSFSDLISQFSSPAPTPTLPTDQAAAERALKEAESLIKRLQSATDAYGASLDELEEKRTAGLISQNIFDRGLAEAALKFADAASGSDEYTSALAALDEAKARGTLTERQYTEAVEEMSERRLVAQNDWVAGVELGLMRLKAGADEVTNEVADAVENWANELGDQIGAVFRTGKFEWKDLVTTMLADIAKLATQQMITRPLAGLFSSIVGGLFGGGGGLGRVGSFSIGGTPIYGDGTDFHPGGMAIVGDRGPELVNLPRGSQVVPNHRLGAMSTAITLAPTYHINGSGLSEGALLAVLEQNNRSLLDNVSNRVKHDIAMGGWG